MTDPKTTPAITPADDLLRAISGESGISQAAAREVLAALAEVCGAALSVGAAVRIPGIGTLEPRAVPAREGTMGGKAWSKPAGRKVVFKPAKALRDRIA